MTNDKTGGPAFPSSPDSNLTYNGMTLRDWFAGKAFEALISKAQFIDRDGQHGVKMNTSDMEQFRFDLAASAFAYADAMLAEREK
jgi:hypothetical protein